MSEFKVGDTVKLSEFDGEPGWDGDMDRYLYCEYKITEVIKHGETRLNASGVAIWHNHYKETIYIVERHKDGWRWGWPGRALTLVVPPNPPEPYSSNTRFRELIQEILTQ